MKPLLLASTSIYKKQVFERLGLPFVVAAPPYEEIKPPGMAPHDVALMLAEGKARSLVDRYPDHVIVAGDQVLEFNGNLLSKPGSVKATVDQILAMSGSVHRLLTAFCVMDSGTGWVRTGYDEAKIWFHEKLQPAFVEKQVVADQSWDCVGGYKFESRGPLFMKSVEMRDPNAIVGLPLFELIQVFDDMGYYADRQA